MKAVIQRVSHASVIINQKQCAAIKQGLLILVGIVAEDQANDIEWLSKKIVNLRIFDDPDGVMNRSLIDINGDAIVVSQFTLQAVTKKGNRPSYIQAATPNIAIPIYEDFIRAMNLQLGKSVGTGVFGTDMKVNLLNDGPVTIVIDTKNKT